MPDPKLDLSRVSREALEALAAYCCEVSPTWHYCARIRAEATAEATPSADLATERAAREQAEQMRDHWCREYAKSQNELATAVERLEQVARERDAALARVKELETELDAALDGMANETTARVAAESALASARELLTTVRSRLRCSHPESASDIDAWLSSAPSPAPAPCSGCAAARELLEESGTVRRDAPEHINAVFAWLKEHGNG